MSKKIFKAWGLILAIMLIASIFVPAAPAAAVYGQSQWLAQSLPTSASYVLYNGSDVTDIAAGPGILYAVDAASSNNTGYVFKSTDGGASWSKSTQAAAVALTKISVAPDNANVIAVTDGLNLYVSSDAGGTWSNLTASGMPGNSAGKTITDIAVAPARSGTLLGREYVIAVANVANANTSGGDILIMGNTASWTTALPAGWTDSRDWMTVSITPNFVGDRSVVALGIGTLASGNSTALVGVFNTANTATTPYVAVLSSNITKDYGTATDSLVSASIALPTDFDATTSSGRRAYAGFGASTAATDNDVYRVDDTAARALGAVNTQKIYSVSYSGTIAAGTLFMAQQNEATVKYSTDMTGNSPTWTATKKLMPSTTTNTVVMVAPDFATSKKIYAATTGAESAFSVSTDGGISFNQKAFIDNGVDNTVVTTGSPSVSGGFLWLVTTDGTQTSLWRSKYPTTDVSWERIWVGTMPTGGFGREGVGVLYLQDDSTAGGNIYRSSDGGATWNTRFAPTTGFVTAVSTWQDENIGYYFTADGTFYKTTNGAWTWTLMTNPNVGTNLGAVTTGAADEIIVGGNGKIGISKDGGASWTTYDGDPGLRYRVTKDTNYLTNKILILADRAGVTNAVYRFQVGTDAKPVSLLAPTVTATTGLGVRSGVLYVGHGLVVDRAINYMDTPGTIDWTTTPAFAASVAVASTFTDGGTIIYGRVSTPATIYMFQDQMATAKPKVTSPAADLSLTVNPVTGVGDLFNVILEPLGSGNGLADRFDVEITEAAIGWAGATATNNISVASPVAPQIASSSFAPAGGMQPNRTYQYRIRAAHQISGSSLDSPWSDAKTVKVASGGVVQGTQYGPVLIGPQGGATNVGTLPGFAWAPIYGANKYRFVLATDAALTKTIAGTPKELSQPSFQPSAALTAGTTYFWSVQVVDPSQGPVSIGTFTTAPKAAPVTAAPVPTITMPPITIPPIVIPPQPTPTITVQAPPAVIQTTTPAFIWAVIIIGAILVIAVIVLIVRTRRVP